MDATREEPIGTIRRIWPRAGAAQVELEGATLRIGERILIRGHGREFVQEVAWMEVDHVARAAGAPGELVSIAVMEPVRERDRVFRLRD